MGRSFEHVDVTDSTKPLTSDKGDPVVVAQCHKGFVAGEAREDVPSVQAINDNV